MPKSVVITKERILDTAFLLARKKGMSGVSNREIAKKLNSSIRPIYYQFKNSLELNKELIDNENIKRGIDKNKMWIYPGQELSIKK